MKTTRYMRRPFYVDVVEVTEENFVEVAKWVEGLFLEHDNTKYIKVDVFKPLSERQTRAYVGDFILKADTGFKVFTRGAFEKSFRPAPPAEENPRTKRGGKGQKTNGRVVESAAATL